MTQKALGVRESSSSVVFQLRNVLGALLKPLLSRFAQGCVAGQLRPQRRRLQRLVHDDNIRARSFGGDLGASIGGGENRPGASPQTLPPPPDRGPPPAWIKGGVRHEDRRGAARGQRAS